MHRIYSISVLISNRFSDISFSYLAYPLVHFIYFVNIFLLFFNFILIFFIKLSNFWIKWPSELSLSNFSSSMFPYFKQFRWDFVVFFNLIVLLFYKIPKNNFDELWRLICCNVLFPVKWSLTLKIESKSFSMVKVTS